MAVAPSSTRSKGATEPRRSSGPVRPFESSECCVRSSGTYAAVPLDLLKWTQGKPKHPRPNRKLTTELDADPIKLFLGAIDPMNPQNPCPRCGRSGFGRADVTSGRHCPLSAPGHKTDMPTVFRDVRFQGQSGKHLLALSFSGFDPNVWSGRALQEVFRRGGGSGLASMYPVSDWS